VYLFVSENNLRRIPHHIFTVQPECSALTDKELGRECHLRAALLKDHTSNTEQLCQQLTICTNQRCCLEEDSTIWIKSTAWLLWRGIAQLFMHLHKTK